MCGGEVLRGLKDPVGRLEKKKGGFWAGIRCLNHIMYLKTDN